MNNASPDVAVRDGVAETTGVQSPTGVVVDVAMPVYRRSTYIAEAIESVLGQSFRNWRLTVFDNGPGGGEIEDVVRRYLSDERISYEATGDVLPVAENWTRAIHRGTAPYVALIHDDDRWHADYLRSRVEALELHPECGFAFAEFVQIGTHGTEIVRAPIRFPEGVVSRTTMAEALTRECIIVPPSIIVRRSAYEAAGAAFSGDVQYCDWEMWARLAARFPAYYLARHDNDFRRHPGTYTLAHREAPAQLIDMLTSVEEIFSRELEGFELTALTRRRNRASVLLHAARNGYEAGGWKLAGDLYRRALREYPPSLFGYESARLLAHTVVGPRASSAVARRYRLARGRHLT